MDTVERYSRPARWFHAAVYLLVLVLLAGGWWFVIDNYQHPLGPDSFIHEAAGLLLLVITALYCVTRARAVLAFLRESTTHEPGDSRWLAAWPRATVSGRFRQHDGHFDPGQRLANLVMLATLTVIAFTGLGMLFLPGNGDSFNAFEIHGWATFALTPVILGHIVIASGVLPGYRGVWRSMHLGGKLPTTVARRIWPGWTSRYVGRS
jgi:formate dehydrogenase subunit gamma